MRQTAAISVLIALLAGCATTSIESRRAKRAEAYNALSADHKTLVDRGDITAGMNEDAIYIAWGKPDQVLRSGDQQGEKTTWLYEGTTTDTHYYWVTFPTRDATGRTILERRMAPHTEFRDYVAAELIFQNGQLTKWRTLPRPASRRYHRTDGYRF